VNHFERDDRSASAKLISRSKKDLGGLGLAKCFVPMKRPSLSVSSHSFKSYAARHKTPTLFREVASLLELSSMCALGDANSCPGESRFPAATLRRAQELWPTACRVGPAPWARRSQYTAHYLQRSGTADARSADHFLQPACMRTAAVVAAIRECLLLPAIWRLALTWSVRRGILIPGGALDFLSELGVALLLFLVGLEFSLGHFWLIRKTVLTAGALQMVVVAALGTWPDLARAARPRCQLIGCRGGNVLDGPGQSAAGGSRRIDNSPRSQRHRGARFPGSRRSAPSGDHGNMGRAGIRNSRMSLSKC
jgi:hypothetical protein